MSWAWWGRVWGRSFTEALRPGRRAGRFSLSSMQLSIESPLGRKLFIVWWPNGEGKPADLHGPKRHVTDRVTVGKTMREKKKKKRHLPDAVMAVIPVVRNVAAERGFPATKTVAERVGIRAAIVVPAHAVTELELDLGIDGAADGN